MLIRQNAPVFGASVNVLPEKGQVELALSLRGLHSDDHYNGTIHQNQRQEEVTYVVNQQKIVDITASYAVTHRLSFSLGIPYVDSSWSIPTPISGPGPRVVQHGRGIGDVLVSGRYWMFNPERHSTGNLSLGLGCKAPTGDYDQRQSYPDIGSGANNRLKVVDQSIQPGDGGWGISFEVQGFKEIGRSLFFASGVYLANPRDMNNADSIIVGAGASGNPAYASILKNSVPDSYLLRSGFTFGLGAGWSASAAFRMEGLPRYDLIGSSHGWRRPGYETFFEPGIVYSRGRSLWSVNMPIAIVRNRQANPYTGFPGDATFPDVIVLAGYSYRFRPIGSGAAPAP